jgi:hypothetical protein
MQMKIATKPSLTTRPTTAQLIEQLNVHEAECTLRYKRIEEKLEENKQAMIKFDMKIWGLAVLIVTTAIAQRLF